MGALPPTHGRRLIAAERRQKALDMRKTGATFQAIAEQLHITKAAAYKSIKYALKEIKATTDLSAEEFITLELERIDRLFLQAYRMGVDGNMLAVDRCVKLMELRGRYLRIFDEQRPFDGEVTIHVVYSGASNQTIAETQNGINGHVTNTA